jgi:hypothetical protein
MTKKVGLDRLPFAEAESYAEQHNPTCLPNTRVELLDLLSQWIDDPHLGGDVLAQWDLGGTGKSTMAR